MQPLSKAEEIVLLTVWRLKENAYGVPIRAEIKISIGKDYTYGTLYGLLRQLAQKGYVAKQMGEPLPKKGGRSRTFFQLTAEGIQALKDSMELHNQVWRDINDLSFEEL